MFTGKLEEPKLNKRPRDVPKIIDYAGVNCVAHLSSYPNECYQKEKWYYDLRRKEDLDRYQQGLIKKFNDERIYVKYSRNTEKTSLQRKINEELKERFTPIDKDLEERRNKIKNLLGKEQTEYMKEISMLKVKISDMEFEEKQKRIRQVNEDKERERQREADEKTFIKYLNRCDEFRTELTKQRCLEVNEGIHEQIKEKINRREAEKELEKLWGNLTLENTKAMEERNKQDQLLRKQSTTEFKFWNKLQLQRQEALREEIRKEKEEEMRQLIELRNQMDAEEKAALAEKKRKHEQIIKEMNDQMRKQNELTRRQTEAAQQIQRSFDKLADEELAKEQLRSKMKVSTARQDMLMYSQYLEELRQSQKVAEAHANVIVDKVLKETIEKDHEQRCQFEKRRQALLEDVIKGRREQVEEKKKLEEKLRKEKEIEAEASRKSFEINGKLQEEVRRQKFENEIKHKQILKEQMRYKQILKERESDDMKRILEQAKEEEQLKDKIVNDILKGGLKSDKMHPFRHVIS